MTDPAAQTELTPDTADLVARLENVEAQLAILKDLPAKLAQVETQLKVVTDIERYGKLQRFLAKQNFKAADRETTRVMLEISGKNRKTLKPEDLADFPCVVIGMIDRLWLEASGGKFGFSQQLKLYREVGGSLQSMQAQDSEMLRKTRERIRWQGEEETTDSFMRKSDEPSNENRDCSINAPAGAFPSDWWFTPYGEKMANFFLMRMESCRLVPQPKR
ncbi:MAG: GUN4 domain-containing protein [Cyanobacteria bacterium P01_H01_bin.15]